MADAAHEEPCASVDATRTPARAPAPAPAVIPPSPGGEASLAATAEALRAERAHSAALADQLRSLRRASARAAAEAEAEEEAAVNRLLGAVRRLKDEKAALARSIDAEEEHISNAMARRAATMDAE
jgi:seryl-tRNA synthetase